MNKNTGTLCHILSTFSKQAFVILLIILFWGLKSAHASTITVCASSCDFTTIQAAINDASTVNGDTINVNDAVHTEQGILVNKDLTIDGQGGIVQANAARNTATDRVFKIANGSTVTIQNMTIRHGTGNTDVMGIGLGGCIIVDQGTLTVVNSTIIDNNASYAGGGLMNNEGTLNINNSTVSGNVANVNGGGVMNHVGTLNINNSTISGNTTPGDYCGIYNSSGTATLSYSTIANNSARTGGGVYNGGTLNIRSTIIADNTATASNPDCAGTLTSQDYNLVENMSGCTINGTTTNNITGQDPKLLTLADNGGSTQTHALDDGSPAIEQISSGTNDCGTDPFNKDQRDEDRPGSRNQPTNKCEMGAWEAQTADPTAIMLGRFTARASRTNQVYLAVISLVLVISAAVVMQKRQ